MLRVSHLLLIFFFFLCCFPCYFCQDSCCMKRWLVNSKGLGPQALANMYENWTWIFKPTKSMEAKSKNRFSRQQDELSHCSICFLQYERGQAVTFLPCQFNRENLLTASDHRVQMSRSFDEKESLTPKMSLVSPS